MAMANMSSLINMGGGTDLIGNIDYSQIRTTYRADDAVAMNITATQDYYIVGLSNFILDPTVVDFEAGWGLFKHYQAASPTFLVAMVGPVLVAEVPSFQAKMIRMIAVDSTGVTVDAYIRFEKAIRVQHYVPAQWTTFNRRCNMFFATAGPLALASIALGRTVSLIVQMYG